MTPMSARDRILDAFEALLTTEGERAATLDAVAASAEVSKKRWRLNSTASPTAKPSSRACWRTPACARRSRRRRHGGRPQGPSLYYVSSSRNVDSPFDRSLIAVARLGWEKHPEASASLRDIQRRWLALIRDEVRDEGVTQAIMLMGDGIYYNAVFGGDVFEDPSDPLANLLQVVRRMVESSPGRTA